MHISDSFETNETLIKLVSKQIKPNKVGFETNETG